MYIILYIVSLESKFSLFFFSILFCVRVCAQLASVSHRLPLSSFSLSPLNSSLHSLLKRFPSRKVFIVNMIVLGHEQTRQPFVQEYKRLGLKDVRFSHLGHQ